MLSLLIDVCITLGVGKETTVIYDAKVMSARHIKHFMA